MICAYQYAQSNCHIQHFQKALLKYSKYLIITAVLNFLILGIDFKPSDAILMSDNAIAYFWFIKTLLLFQLFVLALYVFNEGLLALVLILMLLSSSKYAISNDMLIYFTYFIIGYFYKKSQINLNKYLPWWLMLVSIFTPFILNFQYETVNGYVFITSFLVFNGIQKINDLNLELLRFYGFRSLEAVFFQYIIIEICKRLEWGASLFIKYIIVVMLTSICVYYYTKMYQKIHQKHVKKILRKVKEKNDI